MHLTPRQLDIVRFILRYRAHWGFSPTLQEMADHLGISAVTVFEHTRALARTRAIRRTPTQARSLEVANSSNSPHPGRASFFPWSVRSLRADPSRPWRTWRTST